MTILLRTRCGCEREVETGEYGAPLAWKVPLYSQVGSAAMFRDLNYQPTLDVRTFVYLGKEGGLRVYVEQEEK